MGKNNQNPKDEKTLLEQNIAGLRYEMERLTNLLGVAIRNDSIKKDERVLFDFSDDQANERTIDDIIGKYDGVIVCVAFAQLLQVGISNLRQMDAEEECRKASFARSNSEIIPYNIQKNVIRCAIELAQLSRNELIKFAKLRYPLSGVCLTDGKIIHFKANATNEHIAYCVVDSDVDDRYIEDAYIVLEERLKYLDKKNNGDFSEVNLCVEIDEAFKTSGIATRDIRSYKEFVI